MTELESSTPVGKARLVQLIMIKDHVAYILTLGSLKEEFSEHYKVFDQVLHSFQLCSDLRKAYPSQNHQQHLDQLVQQLQLDFRNYLASESIPSFSQKNGPFPLKSVYLNTYCHPLIELVQQKAWNTSSLKKTSQNTRYSAVAHVLIQLVEKSSLKMIQRKETEKLFFSAKFQSNSWKPFQEKIINSFTEMGPYWQILLLKDIHEKLLMTGST